MTDLDTVAVKYAVAVAEAIAAVPVPDKMNYYAGPLEILFDGDKIGLQVRPDDFGGYCLGTE